MRFQFDMYGCDTLITSRAIETARNMGAAHVRESYPDMKDADGTRWKGTNQPKTVSFSCDNIEQAREIGNVYGVCKIWCIENGGHYV